MTLVTKGSMAHPGLEQERSLEGIAEKNLPTDQPVGKELATSDQGPTVLLPKQAEQGRGRQLADCSPRLFYLHSHATESHETSSLYQSEPSATGNTRVQSPLRTRGISNSSLNS